MLRYRAVSHGRQFKASGNGSSRASPTFARLVEMQPNFFQLMGNSIYLPLALHPPIPLDVCLPHFSDSSH